MIIRILLLLPMLLFSAVITAEDIKPATDAKETKPLNLKLEPDYITDPPKTETSDAFKSTGTSSDQEKFMAYCKGLKQQAEKLKGKPQRRWAMLERYRVECQQIFNSQSK